MTLEEIIEEIKQDERNRAYTERGIPPIFQLSPKARLLIVGQAPGRKVEAARVPFQDKSGEKLRAWLGLDEGLFYSPAVAILPMDFYYPGKGKSGDLPPRPFMAREYHKSLLALAPEVRLTVLIGQYAQAYYLAGDREKTLTETVRHYRRYLPRYFPIVHPSPLNFRWQARNPWFEAEVVPALQNCVRQALVS